MSGSDVIRKFERMFPGIADEERTYGNDLLAEWRTEAERRRRLRDQNKSNEIAQNLNNWERTIIGTYHYDFKNGKETYIPADKKDKTN